MNEADFRGAKATGRLERTSFNELPTHPGDTSKRVDGWGFVPNDLPAGLSRDVVVLELFDDLIKTERELSALSGYAEKINNPAFLIGPFLRKEAQKSSAIEDTFASAEELVLFDVDQTTVDEKSRPEVREVSNYLAALMQGFADPRPLCLNLIKSMHATLLAGSNRSNGRPGEFRKSQNAIGSVLSFADAKFVPPPPRYLDDCLNKLEAYINAKDDMPILVRIALVHYQFECIHPFDDGNGRLGRLLVALQLSKQTGLHIPLVYVSRVLEAHRSKYYKLLFMVSSEGAWIEWIRFMLAAIRLQAIDATYRIELLEGLRRDYHARVQTKRASSLLPKIIDELFASPAITVRRVAELVQVSPVSAGKLVNRLCDHGIIREVTKRRRSRVYIATGVLEIMDRDLEHEIRAGGRSAAATRAEGGDV